MQILLPRVEMTLVCEFGTFACSMRRALPLTRHPLERRAALWPSAVLRTQRHIEVASQAYSTTLQESTSLFSGSYDGLVRVWDCRKLNAPIDDLDTGGGVWRTKWHLEKDPEVEQEREFLILSCMHTGSHIVGARREDFKLASVAQFPQAADLGNDHLAYGIAILDHERKDTTRMLASCSFYENSVSLWDASL